MNHNETQHNGNDIACKQIKFQNKAADILQSYTMYVKMLSFNLDSNSLRSVAKGPVGN